MVTAMASHHRSLPRSFFPFRSDPQLETRAHAYMIDEAIPSVGEHTWGAARTMAMDPTPSPDPVVDLFVPMHEAMSSSVVQVPTGSASRG